MKTLSQDEIDALLSAVSKGEVAPLKKKEDKKGKKSMQVYDFKHPDRISKDQMRTMENMHDNLADQLSSIYSTLQRTVVDVDLISVDQITYSEYISSLRIPSCTYSISMEPLEGAAIIDINPSVTFSFVDRTFGGGGRPLGVERELTGIEKSVIDKVVHRTLKELKKCWEHIINLDIKLLGFESNPQFIQIVAPSETVLVISLQIKILDFSSLITICYPYLTLESILPQLSGQNWMDITKKKNTDADRGINMKNIQQVAAPLVAILGRTDIPIQDLVRLQKGDVIRLDSPINEEIEILVGDKSKYKGKPGLYKKNRAVMITSVALQDNL
jgi:flagellar motor switch protein FliM